MAKVLTKKQELFAREYLVDLNATRAAISAGYSRKTAESQGAQLLQNPKVSAFLSKKLGKKFEKLDISAEKVLAEIAKVAFFDTRKFYDDHGNLKAVTDLDDDSAASLTGLEVYEEYEGRGEERERVGQTKKVKFADRLRALELYGRYLKLFTDKLEHSGTVTLEQLVAGGDD